MHVYYRCKLIISRGEYVARVTTRMEPISVLSDIYLRHCCCSFFTV